MPRVNLQLSTRDHAKLEFLAERSRLQVGSYARLLLVRAVEVEYASEKESGNQEDFPNAELFDQTKGESQGKGQLAAKSKGGPRGNSLRSKRRSRGVQPGR